MNTKIQRLCAWSGALFLLVFFVGWAVCAGYLPPPSPNASAQEIADFYNKNPNLTRLGIVLIQFSCMFYFPWIAVISAQIKRIPGVSSACTYTQLLGGVFGVIALLLPYFFWAAAAFRPERDPNLILLLNDLGWLVFTMTFAPFVAQNVAIAAAIFSDKRAQPLFPRWVAYFNLWVAFTFFPAGFILFFKTGPFTWNGLIGFWIPLTAFSIWMIGMIVLILKALTRQEAEEGAGA
jgi:hypothetical protein